MSSRQSRQLATKQENQVRTRMRELAHRVGNDIDVSLFWRPDDNALLLLLVEVPTGVVFEIPVEPKDAMDAFNHPYAYLPAPAADPFSELLAA
jgi:muconolactone delta-isomerase